MRWSSQGTIPLARSTWNCSLTNGADGNYTIRNQLAQPIGYCSNSEPKNPTHVIAVVHTKTICPLAYYHITRSSAHHYKAKDAKSADIVGRRRARGGCDT
jgi:hypothetical protein